MTGCLSRLLAALLIAPAIVLPVWAQESTPANPPVSELAPSGSAVTLVYANRPIAELRARVLGRMPAERAAAAVRALDDLVARDITSPISTREIDGAVMIAVDGAAVIALVADDVDVLAGARLDETAAAVAGRLQTALAEASELRTPGRLLRSATEVIAVTFALFVLLWLLSRGQRVAARRLTAAAERRVTRAWASQAMLATRVHYVLHHAASLAVWASALLLVYLWVAFVLRRFPYTRPWGESLRSLLLTQLGSLGAAIAGAVPGLFTVAIIFIAARYASKALSLLFNAVEQNRVSIPGVYADTAVPTRRLLTALLWLCALAVAYPYLPGSESPGFKGISVFVGVIVSLGSTGVVQHLMSGLMLTFSRAMHPGDFVRIGEVEGTVVNIGALATQVRTPYGEKITIPHAVVVSQTTTNYSKDAGGTGALVPTSVTIGYDTPWRQVEALLLTAAERTPGVRRTPRPIVWRTSLEDYYVKYTLLVAPEDPEQRPCLLDRLHARILDAFNEHQVQIMSPHYFGDPNTPKIVPRSHWYAAPASPSAGAADVVTDVARHS